MIRMRNKSHHTTDPKRRKKAKTTHCDIHDTDYYLWNLWNKRTMFVPVLHMTKTTSMNRFVNLIISAKNI